MIRVSSVGDSKREENKKPTASSDGVIPDGSITKIPVITKGERKIARNCGFATLVQTSEYIRDMKTAGKRKPWMRDEAYPNDEIVVG
ncbi:hypothetical protein AFLA_005601 [Aspergillus flavus NRRL3357]|nr:hypothetical protein AFLA_005601 [Aspergillus flavus NRRL3357]